MIDKIRQLLEMIRFSHTVFALPFALLGAAMAWSAPTVDGIETGFRWQHLVGILVCMVGARSAAMAFNRIVDRRIDAANPRTEGRHIPAGKIGLANAIVFTLISSIVFVAGTLFFLPNVLPLILALPVLLFLFGYSYAKRFTSLAHFWLGLALSLAPVCAWIAIRGEVVMADPFDLLPSIALGLAVMFWVSGFDMIYACQDFEFDKETGLKSIPSRLGVPGALRLAAVCHLLMVILLAILPVLPYWAGPQLNLGWVYWAAVIAVGALLLYEHSIVRPDDLTRVNTAFFNINAIVGVGLFVLATVDLFVI
ncbi:putative 4-hydroxybenzoate polyprenyltransferase [Vicingaceae bacterium]|nr:putative 4-hydroxybenzoate polyprenyltransferase [Vicingaceae bacterium]